MGKGEYIMAVGRIEMRASVPEHIRRWVASVLPGQEVQVGPRTALEIYKNQLKKAGITGPTFNTAVDIFSRQLPPKEVVLFSNPISNLIKTADTLGIDTAPYKQKAEEWANKHKKRKVIMKGQSKTLFEGLQYEINKAKGERRKGVNIFEEPDRSLNEELLHDKRP